MNIIKPLQASVLCKNFAYQGTLFFAVSLLWGFRLDSGEAVTEPQFWASIGAMLGKNEMFDTGMPKADGEVLLYGSFFSPSGAPVTTDKVSLAFGPTIHKELTIYGNRSWVKTLGAAVGIKGPEPFTEMPVSYANAFGGEGFDKNPSGKGVASVQTETGKITMLPNIEYPDQLIHASGDRPAPAAFNRIDIMSQPRFSKAGTYNKKYIRERMPGLPDDIDLTYFNDAAPDQQIDGFFKGDETFEIINMNPDTPVQSGQLPGVYGRCFVNHDTDGEIIFKEIETQLDTVWFFPHDNLGVLIHRGLIEVSEDDGSDIKQLVMAYENIGDSPRSKVHYQEEMRKRLDPEEGFKYLLNTVPLIPIGCRCGFETIKEESNSPLENLGRQNTQTYAEQKREEMQNEIEKQKAQAEKKKSEAVIQMEKAGVDSRPLTDAFDLNPATPQETPESEKIKELIENIAPGAINDPENFDITRLNLKGFDDLKAFTDKLSAEKRKEAEAQLETEIAKLKEKQKEEGGKEIPDDTIAQLENALAEMKLPPILPRFNLEENIPKIREQITQAEERRMMLLNSMTLTAEQFPPLELEQKIDLDKIEKQLKEAQKKAQEGYLAGAHYLEKARSPHQGREPEIADALLQAYKQNDATAGGDYAFTDLSNRNLAGIDLSNAYLEYVDLTGADLTGANLNNAILAHANLTDTDFTDANLSGANIGATDMHNTRFIDANLTGAILGKAKINGAKFHRCKLIDRSEMFYETQFQKVDFTGSDLQKNNFIDADITECCFKEADLTQSNFMNPQMRHAVFDKTILHDVNFVQAQAENTSFKNADMKKVRFVGGCKLANAKFTGADASEANLRDCDLRNADFSEAYLFKSDFGGSDLSGAQFIRANAKQAQFNKANLILANLYRINLMEGSLYKARLAAADFTEANLYSANLMDSIIQEDDLEETVFTDVNL